MRVAQWDGSAWSPLLGNGTDDVVCALIRWNTDIIAAGLFGQAGGIVAPRVAMWDGQMWSALGGGMSHSSLTARINALVIWDGSLVAAGLFDSAGTVAANNIAIFEAGNWVPIGSGVNGEVFALEVYNNRLIVGGTFTNAGGVPASNLAQRSDLSWTEFEGGVTGGGVRALATDGAELAVGGLFTQVGPWRHRTSPRGTAPRGMHSVAARTARCARWSTSTTSSSRAECSPTSADSPRTTLRHGTAAGSRSKRASTWASA